jgi:predicted transposase YbfD/YdcC
LEALEVSVCIVTIDAMGCQMDIAEKIVEREADYVLALGSLVVVPELAKALVACWLESDFEGWCSALKIAKIYAIKKVCRISQLERQINRSLI